jgi:L-rhamnose isomerase/sugar isomerase
MVLSVLNIQIAYAKALLVDQTRLEQQQASGDVLGAHRTLMAAYETDVRPLLAQVRQELGIHPDPMRALEESGYEAKIAQERGKAKALGGYQS